MDSKEDYQTCNVVSECGVYDNGLEANEHLLECGKCGNDNNSNDDDRVGVSNRICTGGGTEQIWSPSHISIVQQNLTELPKDTAEDTKDRIDQKELEVATAVCAMVKDNEQPTNW